ncbi:MAG: hypothetical protein AAFY28_11680, partial [Actinomycetota bacterium]
HGMVDSRDDLKKYAAISGRFVDLNEERRADIDVVRVRERIDGLNYEFVDVLTFPEGSSELASSRIDLRSAFSKADRGDVLALGAAGSLGVGDGVNVELARLATATGNVSDLIDTGPMQVLPLNQIPPEFQTPGTDSVILTVGVRQRQVVRRTARLVRLDMKTWLTLEATMKALAETSGAAVDGLVEEVGGGAPDQFVATFSEGAIENAEEVAGWWSNSAARIARFAVAARHVHDDEEVTTWKGVRSDKLSDLLTIQDLELDTTVEWELPQHDAIVLLVVGD